MTTLLTPAQVEAIRLRAAAATKGPLVVEKAMTRDTDSFHYSLRTAEKQPETPWSPRYVCWFNGMLADSTNWRMKDGREIALCKTCGQWGAITRRVAGVDLRIDAQIEADATFLSHAQPDVLALCATASALLAQVAKRERPKQRRNDGWHLKIGQIGVFVSVGWYEDGAPMELFLDVSAVGSQLRAEFQLIGKLVSHAWQHGQAVNEVCGQMQEVSYYSPGVHASGHEMLLGRPVKSILEAVGLVLEHEFKLRGLWKA